MPRGIKDQERENRIKNTLKEVEDAVDKCSWMPPTQKHLIMKGDPLSKEKGGIEWVKKYLRSGRNLPSMEQIEEHLFEGRAMGDSRFRTVSTS